MSRIHPTRVWTTQAVIAMLSGDPVCDTCAGHGRIEVTGPRDHRVCPACGGRGIPRSLQDWTYDNVSRGEFKAYRQATR
jgi:DnaJ-class molecular chaperone